MGKIFLVIAVFLCSFVFNDFAGADEENKFDAAVNEKEQEVHKKILNLHQFETMKPMPHWHKNFLPEEQGDSRCPGSKTDPVDGSIKCQMNILEW